MWISCLSIRECFLESDGTVLVHSSNCLLQTGLFCWGLSQRVWCLLHLELAGCDEFWVLHIYYHCPCSRWSFNHFYYPACLPPGSIRGRLGSAGRHGGSCGRGSSFWLTVEKAGVQIMTLSPVHLLQQTSIATLPWAKPCAGGQGVGMNANQSLP